MIEFEEYKSKLNDLKPKLEELRAAFVPQSLLDELERLHAMAEAPGFWDDPARSQKAVMRTKTLERKRDKFQSMCSEWDDLMTICEMALEENDDSMLETCVETAKELELPYHVGNILSSDRFYGDDGDMTGGWIGNQAWKKMGVMAVEMEAAALYMNAARAGKRALAICTVSDHLLRNENCTAEERQNGFTNMMKLALETAVKLEK